VSDTPDLQRAILVIADSSLAEAHEIQRAAQVLLVGGDGVSASQLRSTVMGLTNGGSFAISERRNFYDWGERGDDVQELVLTCGEDSDITPEQFVKVISDLRVDGLDDAMLGDTPPPADTDAAWDLFADVLERSCRASRLRCQSIEESASGWTVEALGRSGYRYLGSVSHDGRVVDVTRSAF